MLKKDSLHRRKNSINILFAAQSKYIGGAEIALRNIINKLDKKRFRPFIVFPSSGQAVNLFKQQGFFSKVISTRKWENARNKILSYLRDNNIRLVHVNTIHPFGFMVAMAARLMQLPVIWQVHCDLNTVYPQQNKKDKERMLELIYLLSKRVIACSRYAKEQFERKGLSGKVTVINYGIDLKKFRSHPENLKNAFRGKIGIGKNDFWVGMVGRISPEKRHRDYIRAAAAVRSIDKRTKFIAAGIDGTKTYMDRLRRLNKQNNNPVIFIGFFKDAARLMNCLDLLVMPSVGDASPLVILEAMASGKTVVAADSGGIPELVSSGKTGILVSPKKPKELAQAIIKIIRNPAKRANLSKNARRNVKINYNINKVAKKFEALYLELLKNKSRKVNA